MEDAYANGLELWFSYEERTQPFRGATGVTHPLLAEAATQFQAQAFNERCRQQAWCELLSLEVKLGKSSSSQTA